MNGQDNNTAGDPFAEILRAWGAMASAVLSPGSTPESLLGSAGARGSGPRAQLAAILAKAQLVSSAALWRSWERAAQSWADYGRATFDAANVGAALPAAPLEGEALASAVDEARTHLRRVAEIALDEARLLEAHLSVLDEELRATLGEPEGEPAPRRNVRAKP
jgi:hypothetical protein